MIMDVFTRFRRRKSERHDTGESTAGPTEAVQAASADATESVDATERATTDAGTDTPAGTVGIPKQTSAERAPDNAERPLVTEPGTDGGRQAAVGEAAPEGDAAGGQDDEARR